jgi:CRISPR-associated protein (TIGR02584 family)
MHWLIASMGTSPEVLTEALFCLESTGNQVAHVTCVGTGEAFQNAESRLFSRGGALERLRAFLNRPAEWLSRESFHWETEPLNTMDSRNREEARAMDRAFTRAILQAQKQGDGPVAACISGGRKTMSSSLQQAMALLARPEDWAFHILLNLPEGLSESEVFKRSFAFPGDPQCLDLAEVGSEIIEVPLVRLRALAASRNIDLADPALIEHYQRAVNAPLHPPRLLLDLRDLSLHLLVGSMAFRIRKLTPPQALLMGAWGLSGKPGMRRKECRKELERVLAIWRRTPGFFPRVAGDSKKIEDYIYNWTHADDGLKNLFETAVTRLKRSLTGGNPLLDPFALRSLDPKGTVDPDYGFAPAIHGQGLIEVRF